MTIAEAAPKTRASRPSQPLEKRIAKAERQRDFARKAGWPVLEELYDRLAAELRSGS